MKKVFGLIAVMLSITMIVGLSMSGAFISEREIWIKVREDSKAYLRLDACDGTSGLFVHEDAGSGKMVLKFGASGHGGKGPNPDSMYAFDDVFRITNCATEKLKVYVKWASGAHVLLYYGTISTPNTYGIPTVWPEKWTCDPTSPFYEDPPAIGHGERIPLTLDVGESRCIGVAFGTFGAPLDTWIKAGEFIIWAVEP